MLRSTSIEPKLASDPAAQLGEQRFVIHGVTWKDYTILRDVLDVAGLRMTYLEGCWSS